MNLRKSAGDRSEYLPLAKDEEDRGFEVQPDPKLTEYPLQARPSRILHKLAILIGVLFAAVVGFVAGAVSTSAISSFKGSDSPQNMAARIPLPTIDGAFIYHSPFSREPPQGEGSGNVSEPIWDALIPNGLGYFKDGNLAPKISLPTVIHQLHCLYILRRAYYSQSDELQDFDFGKDRSSHAAHCFDYLVQSITCAVDSTVEPAEDDPNGFLGSGFPRQCRDFDALKEFVERNRVFNATGFLALGLDHGKVHVDSD